MSEPAYDAVLDHILDWSRDKATIEAVDLPEGPDGAIDVKLSVGRRQGSRRVEPGATKRQTWAALDELAETLGAGGVKAAL